MANITTTDFSNYLCAYQNHDISVYPESVRPTVNRMKMLSQSACYIDLESMLGQGVVGSVHKGYYVDTMGATVNCAIKIFEDAGVCAYEANMLWKCAGVRSIVNLHGLLSFDLKIPNTLNALVMDYVEGPIIGLAKTFLQFNSEKQSDAIELARQLFEFLVEIKTPSSTRKTGLIHTDLSNNNVFWNNRKLVVIDTTFMVEIGSQSNPVVQVETARAPEVFLNQKSERNDTGEEIREKARYSESVDVWSVGALVHRYVIGTPLNFKQDDESLYGQAQVSQLVGRIGMPPASYLKTAVAADKFFDKKEDELFVLKPALAKSSQHKSLEEIHTSCPNSSLQMLDLMKRIFVWNPEERITAEQALTLPIFKK